MAEQLKDFGPESKPGGNRAECGGCLPGEEKQIPYNPPKGPTEQMRQRPGLGGEVRPSGSQGRH